MRNAADSNADAERFVQRVAGRDQVWILSSPQFGTAHCRSIEWEDEDGNAPAVLLFFSDAAYARRVGSAQFEGYAPEAIALFDFLYRWLPGMSGDGHFAGPNWSAGLTGREVDPLELRERIDAAMGEDRRLAHAREYERRMEGKPPQEGPGHDS